MVFLLPSPTPPPPPPPGLAKDHKKYVFFFRTPSLRSFIYFSGAKFPQLFLHRTNDCMRVSILEQTVENVYLQIPGYPQTNSNSWEILCGIKNVKSASSIWWTDTMNSSSPDCIFVVIFHMPSIKLVKKIVFLLILACMWQMLKDVLPQKEIVLTRFRTGRRLIR